MVPMLRIIRIFFIGMGIVFTLVLGGLAYIVIADPFHIRPIITLLMQQSAPAPTSEPVSTEPSQPAGLDIVATPTERGIQPVPTPVDTAASGPTPAQRAALESVGINPSTVLEGITDTQLECMSVRSCL
jgi:hypothetical protein